MIVIMSPQTMEEDIEQVQQLLAERGYGVHLSRGVERTIIGAIGALDEEKALVAEQLEVLPAVERVVAILKPYKLVSREGRPERSVVRVGDVEVGAEKLAVIAGPCSVESEQQLLSCAEGVKEAGADILRGGAYKPRTSPYDFQGLGEEGLRLLAAARERTGLPIVTEVRDVRQVALVNECADLLQIGARNMQNFDLLKEVGGCDKPVLLKRGLAATIEEWLKAAEHIAAAGNLNIILCERGIRTFDTTLRYTFDLGAIPVAKAQTHLPVIADPSHASGQAEYVAPLALGAIAAGADGVMIEVHPQPERALSDGPQSLTPSAFAEVMHRLRSVAQAVGRSV